MKNKFLNIFIVFAMLCSISNALAKPVIITSSDDQTGTVSGSISENFDDFSTTATTPGNDTDYYQPSGWYLAHRWSSQVNGFLRPVTDSEKGAVVQVGMNGTDGGSSHAYLPLNKDITKGKLTISFDMKPERAGNIWGGKYTNHPQTPNLIIMAYPDGIDNSDMNWGNGNSASIGKNTLANGLSESTPLGKPIAGIFAFNISTANNPTWESMTNLKTLTMDTSDTNKVSASDSKWYNLKIELNFDTGTTAYYLDGACTNGASLSELQIDGIQGISFGTNSNAVDASTLIDNISVNYEYTEGMDITVIKNETFNDFSTTAITPGKDTDYHQPSGWHLAHRWSSQINGFLRPVTDSEKGAVAQVGMLGNDGSATHAYLPFNKNITTGQVTISCDIKPERAGNVWEGKYANNLKTTNFILMVYPDGIDGSDMNWGSGNSVSIGKHTLASGLPESTPLGKPIAGIFAFDIATANDYNWDSRTILKTLSMDTTDTNKVSTADSKWYNLKIELNFDAGTTAYYLDGVRTTGASLAELQIDGIQGISFGTNSNAVDSSTLIDNIVITHKVKQAKYLRFNKLDVVDEAGTSVSYNNSNIGEKLYLNAEIDNIDNADRNIMLILARYQNDILKEIDFEKTTISVGGSYTCGVGTENEISVSRPVLADEYYKIYALNTDVLAPYINTNKYYEGKKLKLLFNNEECNTDLLEYPPVNIMGTDYIPVEYVAKMAGYTVTDNGDEITISGNDNTIVLIPGTDTANVNGSSTPLYNSAVEREGALLITVDDMENLISVGEDVTEYPGGIALHTEYYDDDTTFFNLTTTFSGDPKTRRGFSWEAMPEYNNMVIEYSKGNQIISPTRISATYETYPVIYNYTTQNLETTDGISFYDNMLFYKAELKDLTPGTTYTYRIGDTGMNVWSDEYTFTTESTSVNDFSIIAVADSQASNVSGFDYYKNTVQKALSEKRDASFLVHLGDIVENGMCDDWWNMFFEASKGIHETLPLVPVVGNHETRINGTKYYNLHFNNPSNGSGLVDNNYNYSAVSKREAAIIRELDNTVYSFDYGNTHFAVLNTGTDWDSEDWKTKMPDVLNLQTEWLKEDMESSDKKWKVLILHIGVYTARERSSAYLLYDIIDECGIDLVLSGHDHVTMRTKPMYNDHTTNVGGTVYSIMGCAGSKRYGFNSGTYSYIHLDKIAVPQTETDSKNPTYNILSFSDDKISVISKALDGNIIDSYTVTK